MTTTFEAPGPGRWELDRSHFPGGTTPIAQWLMVEAMEAGMTSVMAENGVPASTIRARFVNGYMYTRLVPLIGADKPPTKLPPAWVLKLASRAHPAFRARNRTARESLEQRPWNDVVVRWHTELRPSLDQRNRAFQSQQPNTLDDAQLADHVDRLLDHLRETTELHFWLHGHDLGPIARYLHACTQWGLQPTVALDALSGASPSTSRPLEQLAAIRAEVESHGVAVSTLSTLDEVRAASPEAARLLDEYLDERGDMLVTGYDITSLTLRELPGIVLAALRSATPPQPIDDAALATALRDRVPVAERQRFDVLLADARVGVMDGRLEEWNYSEVADEGKTEFQSIGGWLGITDKYWLASLVPQQDLALRAGFRHQVEGDRYQTDYRGDAITLAPGQTVGVTDRLFAGAKIVTLLDRYRDRYNIPLFDRAVDFGWFYFLTKPIFYVLHWIHGVVLNYGVAILVLTLLVKALFFPLADKSYRAMAQMKKLQPAMMEMRERYGDDKVKMNQELMALYKKEKVNPVSGCLPIIIQIPVFFALDKVLFVTIEMRHAPFFGWIQDLWALGPDQHLQPLRTPAVHPAAVPDDRRLARWIMGLTMWLQTKLNPAPTDPIQAKVMQLLPLMFIFLFATFPAGLVIYWSWNNILSIGQQWAIMRRMGVKAS